jgi:phosphate uptake regulator
MNEEQEAMLHQILLSARTTERIVDHLKQMSQRVDISRDITALQYDVDQIKRLLTDRGYR